MGHLLVWLGEGRGREGSGTGSESDTGFWVRRRHRRWWRRAELGFEGCVEALVSPPKSPKEGDARDPFLRITLWEFSSVTGRAGGFCTPL
jgi:hypothetical protein